MPKLDSSLGSTEARTDRIMMSSDHVHRCRHSAIQTLFPEHTLCARYVCRVALSWDKVILNPVMINCFSSFVTGYRKCFNYGCFDVLNIAFMPIKAVWSRTNPASCSLPFFPFYGSPECPFVSGVAQAQNPSRSSCKWTILRGLKTPSMVAS